MANIQHPEGLEEGLRQSAAGEVVDLGSFDKYIPVEDRKVGEIFELSEEDKDQWPNGRNYERFTVIRSYDENYAVPVRSGIIATYTEYDLGYLIQQTEDGFRYIGVEGGEEDIFGDFYGSKKVALQSAVSDWRENGQGDSWATWSRQMAKDSVASDASTIDPKIIENFLAQEPAAASLTKDQISTITAGLAALLSEEEHKTNASS